MTTSERIVDDEAARKALDVLEDPEQDEQTRAQAAVALGPGLETCDQVLDWNDAFEQEAAFFSQQVFQDVRTTLESLYRDESAPKLVRRRALEASVRARQEWHEEAVRHSFDSGDLEWQVTAVFCMAYVPGFEAEVMKLLRTKDVPVEVFREAVFAVGQRELKQAEPILREVAGSSSYDTRTRINAVEALAYCGTGATLTFLDRLAHDADEEVAEAAEGAKEELSVFMMGNALFGSEW